MASNVNFANREVANLYIVDYFTKNLFMYCDWANTTSTSMDSNRVFATGGQGAPNRVQFDGERTGTLTVEAQVYPDLVYKMLAGEQTLTETSILKREVITAAADSGEVYLELSSPVSSLAHVTVYADGDDNGTALTLKELKGANLISGDPAFTAGSKYIVYYFGTISGTDNTIIHFDASHFAKAYEVYGSVPYKKENGDLIEATLKWYKVSPQGGFELSYSNTGDPVSVSLQFDVMADTDGNIFDMIFPNA